MNNKTHEIVITFTASITVPYEEGVGFPEAADKVDSALRGLIGGDGITHAELVRVKKLTLEEA